KADRQGPDLRHMSVSVELAEAPIIEPPGWPCHGLDVEVGKPTPVVTWFSHAGKQGPWCEHLACAAKDLGMQVSKDKKHIMTHQLCDNSCAPSPFFWVIG